MTKIYVSKIQLNNEFNFLCNDELKEHLLSIKDKDRLNQSYSAYSILQKIIGKKLEIAFEQSGKPYYKNNEIFFSLSHTEKFVCVAVSNDKVGVDIEVLKDKDYSKLFKACLSTTEQVIVHNSKNQNEEFLKLWTKKEAYLKFQGCGINQKPFKIEINEEELNKNGIFVNSQCLKFCGQLVFLSIVGFDKNVEVIDKITF